MSAIVEGKVLAQFVDDLGWYYELLLLALSAAVRRKARLYQLW